MISVLTGEGGSGGALALAAADRVWMLENAVYSVISPEGCASILWKDAATPRAFASFAVSFRLSAAFCAMEASFQRMLAQPSGEMTE